MKTLARLTWRERRRAVEAMALLTIAGVAIRLLPFRWIAAAADRLPERTPSSLAPATDARALARIVDACADRLPWRPVCFPRGMAAHAMMRRRGLPSILHYGAAQAAEHGLNAHVWVVVDDAVVIGGKGLAGHVTLARFPANAAR